MESNESCHYCLSCHSCKSCGSCHICKDCHSETLCQSCLPCPLDSPCPICGFCHSCKFCHLCHLCQSCHVCHICGSCLSYEERESCKHKKWVDFCIVHNQSSNHIMLIRYLIVSNCFTAYIQNFLNVPPCKHLRHAFLSCSIRRPYVFADEGHTANVFNSKFRHNSSVREMNPLMKSWTFTGLFLL